MMAGHEVERETVLPAPIDEVWAAVTEPEHLSVWLGVEVELERRPGGRGTARRYDGATRRIVVEVVDEPRRFAFRWWPFEHGRCPGMSTRVEFTLDPERDGTRVRVVEQGLPEPMARSEVHR